MTIRRAKQVARLVFRWCLSNGRVDEFRGRQVVQSILQSKRRGYIKVLAQFQHLMKLQRFQQTAKVESAMPLSRDLPARIQEALVRVYGSEITTVFTQNPSLIGGLRIQVGCDVYDGSVRSRLATLKTSFGIAPERKESHPI